MKSILFAFALVAMISCSTTKTVNETTNKKETTAMDAKKMIENGFERGVIIASTEEKNCPFVIEVAGRQDNYYLDPINLDEAFKKGGEKIWFKYNGLRMMNRCEYANPVSITEIQKRAE
ncbi:MAG: hypothetical protein R2776_10050 [Flavobacteriaceae bacterium]|nr:hypothetical protein [Flavobacteriaceae bacterium]